MSLRYRSVLPLVAVCLALAVAPAFAAKSLTDIKPLGNAPVPNATINSADCQTGQTGPVAFSIQFIFPPNDEYYTLLDPAGCCPGGATALTFAHAILNWPSPCQIPVAVSILGATGDPLCPVPDPNNVICPPTVYVLDGSAGGVIQHDFPLPGGCCIQGKAFLKIDFINNGNCTPTPGGLDAPRLITDNTPDACTSYNFYPGDPVFRDLVSFYGFPGNPVMWADGHCCGATPTIPSSWGSVKSLYR